MKNTHAHSHIMRTTYHVYLFTNSLSTSVGGSNLEKRWRLKIVTHISETLAIRELQGADIWQMDWASQKKACRFLPSVSPISSAKSAYKASIHLYRCSPCNIFDSSLEACLLCILWFKCISFHINHTNVTNQCEFFNSILTQNIKSFYEVKYEVKSDFLPYWSENFINYLKEFYQVS